MSFNIHPGLACSSVTPISAEYPITLTQLLQLQALILALLHYFCWCPLFISLSALSPSTLLMHTLMAAANQSLLPIEHRQRPDQSPYFWYTFQTCCSNKVPGSGASPPQNMEVLKWWSVWYQLIWLCIVFFTSLIPSLPCHHCILVPSITCICNTTTRVTLQFLARDMSRFTISPQIPGRDLHEWAWARQFLISTCLLAFLPGCCS